MTYFPVHIAPEMNHATLAALAASATLAAGACKSDRSKCEELATGRDFAATHEACARAFEKTGDATLGAHAAVGAFYSKQEEAGELLLEQLADAPEAGTAWRAAGDLRYHQGEREKASENYRRALRVHQAAGNQQGAARVWLSLSTLAWLAAEYETAGDLAAKAEAAARQANDEKLLIEAAKQNAAIYYDIGAYDAMRAALDSLREIAGPDFPELRLSEGLLHLDEGRADIAHAQFKRALDEAPAHDSKTRRAALLNMARADIERQQPEHGVAHVDAAAKLANDAVESAAIETYRARLANALDRPQEALAAAKAGLNATPARDWRWELALEAGRALRSLGDAKAAETYFLTAVETLDAIRADHDRSDYKQAMLARKRAPYDALVELYVASGKPLAALAVAEKARARALVEAIANEADDLASIAAAREIVAYDVSAGIAALGNSTAVAYYKAAESYYRFVVTDQRVDATRLPTPADEIERTAKSLRANPDNTAAAAQLGTALAPPRAKQIYFIVDGILADTPLAAMRVSDRYLVEYSNIAVSPSLAVLGVLERRSRQYAADRGALVLGDPRSDLPAARDEALAVAEALGTEAQLGTQANAAALSARPAILHIAAHASREGLVMADQTVSAANIVRRGSVAAVVVLATCRGAERRDGGLLGSLAGAFLVAGSRAVVASLRSIDDDDARQLMLAMYAAGNPAKAPAASLADAQRSLISKRSPPSRWSVITIIGLAHPTPQDPNP